MRRKFNLPNVGDTIYWKDLDGNMHDDVVLRIDKDPDPDILPKYFVNLYKNGGGAFLDEDSLIDPSSKEVTEYKKKRASEKTKEIADYLSQSDVHEILFQKLNKEYSADESEFILEILRKEV